MDTLNYLKTLGINAIEVMPFNNFEGASSWGYNPNFYFAPDKVYGTSQALKQFVDACHQKGLAVLMDMVLNHSFGSSPMVQMYWDPVNNIPASNSPWFSPYYTHDYDVGYQFNNSSPATQTFRERVISYWLQNYHIDGYRFDLATGFSKINSCQANGTNCNDALWASYDTTRINIWNALYSAEQSASPGSYCILEMFSANNERTVYANEGMMVWNDLSYNYEQATMGYSSVWDLSGATSSNIGVPQQGIINYQGSHDDERLMYKNENFGNSNNFYNIKDTITGLKRNEMSATFWAMVPGPKMLWQFDELGYDYSINWCFGDSVDPSGNCRLTPKPPRWDYMLDSNRRHLHNVYASLFRLNDSFPSLASATSVNYSLSGALKVMQISTSALNLTVLGNFDISPNTSNITFQHAGTWYNYLGTDSIIATGGSQGISLNAGAYGVYTDVNLNKVSVDTTQNPPPPDTATIKGLQVNPNPIIGSSSVIQYNLSASSDVSLSMYNMAGQRIFLVDLGTQATGNHSLTFNDLPFNIFSVKSGIYVLKLNSATGTQHVNISVLH